MTEMSSQDEPGTPEPVPFEQLATAAAAGDQDALALLVAASRQVVRERDAAFDLLRWLSQRDPALLSLLVEISERAENIWLDDVLLPARPAQP